MAAWMLPAATLAGNALGGFMSMIGGNQANAMSNSLAQQQMMQQQGFVNAQRMDQYHFADQSERLQREMAMLGIGHAKEMAGLSHGYAMDAFQHNANLQREFAQQGLKWRMEDAQRAGIHPLFAIGAGGASAAPIQISGSATPASVGSGGISGSPVGGGSPGVPSFVNPMAGFAGLGQDLGRAIAATQTARERQADQVNYMEVERHEWARQEHMLRMAVGASRLAVTNQEQKKGGMPETVGPVGMVEKKPYDITVGASPTSNAIGPGQPSVEWRAVGGGITAMPAQGLNIDDFSSPGFSSWMIPNKIEPFFERNPSAKPAPEVWKRMWPNAQDVKYHFGVWYPVYHQWPAFDGLRNAPGPRPGVVKGMFIDRR